MLNYREIKVNEFKFRNDEIVIFKVENFEFIIKQNCLNLASKIMMDFILQIISFYMQFNCLIILYHFNHETFHYSEKN